MRLVILYGSEAVGKLTVARELEKKTELRLFHNHVSIDIGKVLFNYGEDAFTDLVWKARLLVFETAARHDVPGLIFTWAYSHPDFQPLLDRLVSTLRPYDVDLHFVHLTCSQSALEARVVSRDRRLAGKISSVQELHRQQQAKNHAVIPDTSSLEIDNTDLPPSTVADMIISRFAIPGQA